MPILLLALILKLASLAPFLLAGLIAESVLSRNRVPARTAATNVGVMVLHFGAFILITATLTAAAIRGVVAMPHPAWLPQPRADTWPRFIAWTIALTVFMDFCYYWMHRAQHRIPVLWAQHAVHHSDEHFNVTTAWRIHWTEPLLEIVFMIAPVSYLFVSQPAISLAIGVLSDAINAFAHLNVPMRWRWLSSVINTPQYHRAHHSYLPKFIDRNYAGKFPIWDRLFGSFAEPSEAREMPTGLASGERIETVTEAAIYPLRKWLRWRRREARSVVEV